MLKHCKIFYYAGLLTCLCLIVCSGCQKKDQEESPPAAVVKPSGEAPSPPSPPIAENFDGEPQMSLFPRLADFRPEDDDTEHLAYWKTFMQHVGKTSGVVPGTGIDNSRAFAIRSLKNGPSVAFFSPIAVEPSASYRVIFHMRGELSPEEEAGVGVLEFDQFLWIGEQYTESLSRQHFIRSQDGLRLSGPLDWEEYELTFTTSAKTGMIHLIFHRQGAQTRAPVLFDDIRVEKIPSS